MCGRFTLTTPTEIVAQLFDIASAPSLRPRYNIAPTQDVAAVRRGDDGNTLVLLRWGLVPSWAKDPAIGNRMINARAETVADKPAFRSALRKRRCLIPADGFYEWRKSGSAKQPYLLRRADDRPFALAGLWERWQHDDSASIESCTILTTTPNDLMRPIHDRMPVILAPDAWGVWLDPATQDPEGLRTLLTPCAEDLLVAEPVSTYVNSPRNDDPRCREPLRTAG